MRKEFMVERQGKTFCLYAGLLDLAHQNGLQSISTTLIQIPHESNNRTAICLATVKISKDGVDKEFTGIGDAAENNVAPAMKTCLIRMAETRAKARALRDAVNIGIAAFEELGEEVEERRSRPSQGSYQKPAQVRTASAPPVRNNSGDVASDAQVAAIRNLCMKSGKDADHYSPETLSVAEASDLIRKLNTAKVA